MSDDGPIHWSHFLTGRDDRTIWNVSFLSRPAEWHAVGVGAAVGLTGRVELLSALVAYLLGRGTGKLPDVKHIKDAGREPAYALFGLVLGLLGHLLVFGGAALQVIP